MTKNEFMQKEYGIDADILKIIDNAEAAAAEELARIDEMASLNQLRVMRAFYNHRVSEAHFAVFACHFAELLSVLTVDNPLLSDSW